MEPQDPEKTWREHYERKKAQRLEEAATLWQRMFTAGVTEATVLALDFLHFGRAGPNAAALAKQLSKNYEVEVTPAQDGGYWCVKGTTRPHGITLTAERQLDRVSFMADIARSYACVFSTWSLEAPSLGVKFESEHVESIS